MAKRNNPSPEVVAEAMQVAKATQKPGQTITYGKYNVKKQ